MKLLSHGFLLTNNEIYTEESHTIKRETAKTNINVNETSRETQ